MQDTLSPTIEAPTDELAQALARIAELEATVAQLRRRIRIACVEGGAK
jgi:hypothetical protein